MAWPPPVAGTWAVRHSFVGSHPRPQSFQYVNDNLIYYGDFIGVAIYDAIGGTSTIIGDFDDWGLGDVFSHAFAMLGETLYVMMTSFYDLSEKVKVFRYNGSPHDWTLVFQADNWNPHDYYSGGWLARVPGGLIVSSNEGIKFSGPTPSLGGWSLITDEKGIMAYPPSTISHDSNQCFLVLSEWTNIDTPGDPPEHELTLVQCFGGSFSAPLDIDPPIVDYQRVPGYHWSRDGSVYSIDGSTWIAPTVDSAVPINLKNYTRFAGFDDSANRVYYWDPATNQWSPTFDTLTPSLMQDGQAVVLSDGTFIMGRYIGSETSFWERDISLDTEFTEEEEDITLHYILASPDAAATWVSLADPEEWDGKRATSLIVGPNIAGRRYLVAREDHPLD